MSFTKLFSSITASTIWTEPDHTRIVWITMLAMADRDGYVAASVPGLAAMARVPLESVVVALESFQSPDRWSRTKDYDGQIHSVQGVVAGVSEHLAAFLALVALASFAFAELPAVGTGTSGSMLLTHGMGLWTILFLTLSRCLLRWK